MGLDPNVILQLVLSRRAEESRQANALQLQQQQAETRQREQERSQAFELGKQIALDPTMDEKKIMPMIQDKLTPFQYQAIMEFGKSAREKAKAAEIGQSPGAALPLPPVATAEPGLSAPPQGPDLDSVLRSLRSIQQQAGGDPALMEAASRASSLNAGRTAAAQQLLDRQSARIAGRQQQPDQGAAARANTRIDIAQESLTFRKKQALTSQWDRLAKDQTSLRIASDAVDELAKLKTAQGDVEILYSLAKADDPRVSDQDFRLRAMAGSYGDQARTWFTKALSGPLPDDIRQRLIAVTKSKLAGRMKSFNAQRKAFTERVRKENIDPSEVMVSTATEGSTPNPIPAGMKQVGEVD